MQLLYFVVWTVLSVHLSLHCCYCLKVVRLTVTTDSFIPEFVVGAATFALLLLWLNWQSAFHPFITLVYAHLIITSGLFFVLGLPHGVLHHCPIKGAKPSASLQLELCLPDFEIESMRLLLWFHQSVTLFVWVSCVSSHFSDSGCRVATLSNPLTDPLLEDLLALSLTSTQTLVSCSSSGSPEHLQREVLCDYPGGQRHGLLSGQRGLYWHAILNPEYQSAHNQENKSLHWHILWVWFDTPIWNKKSLGYHYLCALGRGSNLLLPLGLHPKLKAEETAMGQHHWSMDWIGGPSLPGYRKCPSPWILLSLIVVWSADTMVTTQSSSSPPPNDKVMLEHVVTVILKQAKDGPIAKALAAAALEEINYVLLLNQLMRDALTYLLDDGMEKPLPKFVKGTQDLCQLLSSGWWSHWRLDYHHQEGLWWFQVQTGVHGSH